MIIGNAQAVGGMIVGTAVEAVDTIKEVLLAPGTFITNTVAGTWAVVEYGADTFHTLFVQTSEGIISISQEALSGIYGTTIEIVQVAWDGGMLIVEKGIAIYCGTLFLFCASNLLFSSW